MQTIRRYSRSWAKILRYTWGTARKEEWSPCQLTPKQERSLQALQDSVYDERDSSVDVDDDEPRTRRLRPIENHAASISQVSLACWLATLDHESNDHEYERHH